MKRIVCSLILIFACGSLGMTAHAQQAAAPTPPPKTAPDVEGMLKTILDNQRILDTKLTELQRRLDSISRFLGDQNASSFDTVDRRLREIEDDVKNNRR